jgi:Rrf2 family protein
MIMRLSEGVEWGVHCLAVLALLPEGKTLTGKALAEFHGISPTYLLKHMQSLASAGIVESIPGPRGGFRLARPPEAISMLDTLMAIDGAEAAFRCTEIRQRSPVKRPASAFAMPCPVKVAMLKADAAWRNALANQTVADIILTVRRIADPDAARRQHEWLLARAR